MVERKRQVLEQGAPGRGKTKDKKRPYRGKEIGRADLTASRNAPALHSFRRVGSEARDHEASRVLRSVIGIYAQLPIPIEGAFRGMNGTITVCFTHAFVKSSTEIYALPATDWIIDPMGGGKYCSVTVTASDETGQGIG